MTLNHIAPAVGGFIPDLEIRPFLTISTAHITHDTATMLDITPEREWPVAGGRYGSVGYFLYAHDDNGDETIPDDLWAVYEFARESGANYVLLDCDANEVAGLPTYIWEDGEPDGLPLGSTVDLAPAEALLDDSEMAD